ncbi:MAG: KTSC domain-containing protein [Opitutus sp.]
MRRQAVNSDTINSVGYDRATRVVEIEFTGGAIYRYSPVPVYIFRELLDAPSKGTFVNSVIKPRFKSEGPIKP